MKSIRNSVLLVITLVIIILFTTPIEGSANWWDKFGEPKYGGSITLRMLSIPASFDTWTGYDPFLGWLPWFDNLFCGNWALDRKIWSFTSMYFPTKYCVGNLAESWEQPDAQTMVIHLRHGVHWQDKAPMNGREFVANDVVYHYDRLMGTGSGFTEPDPYYAMWLSAVQEVRAADKYTISFKFKVPGIAGVWTVMDQGTFNQIEAPESIKEAEGGQVMDWKKAVGTGAWMLTDYVSGTSMTLSRNPNYWRFDERHPKNRLPYADTLRSVVIKDPATAIAALRTGKIDIMTDIDWRQGSNLSKLNPELQQRKVSPPGAVGLHMRVDKEPFNDIRVRKAMQMAIDNNTISKIYYGGNADPTPAGIVNRDLKGYNFPYEDWPSKLKEEYSYDLAKAKELLKQAGYSEGFKTNCIVSNTDDIQILEAIKSQFKDIGVDMEIKVMDDATFWNLVYAYKHDQMAVHMGTKIFPPSIMISTYFSKNQRDNMSAVNDPGYDEIVKKFSAALTEDEAAQFMSEADRWAIENHPTVFLPAYFNYNVWQPYLKGYSGEALQWNNWQYLTRLWIDQDLKASIRR